MANPIRIGAVNYLNTKPLICDLEMLAPEGELVLDLPSRLADLLVAHGVDGVHLVGEGLGMRVERDQRLQVGLDHGVDPALVREVARQESGFRPCVVSPKGAEGLMQLMPATQAQFQVRDPFQAEESLAAGAKLLKQLLDRYNGDLSLALSAYNAGSGRVDKAGGIPEIPETKNYVAEILGRLLQ